MKRKNNTGKLVFNIIVAVITLLAHVSLLTLFLLSYRYYSMELNTFMGVLGAFVCLLVIIDILFFVGFNYKIESVRIINCILATLVLVVGIVGSFYVYKLNTTVDKVIDNSGSDQYEVISGVFSYYKNNDGAKSYSDIEDLKQTSSLRVGVIYDDGVGTGTLASKIIEENGINATIVQYYTTDDLLSALVGGEEENVDVAVFPASYRQRLGNDENVDYSQYLDNIVDFYSFEEKVKTDENENANRDLSTEPFNILLIGFAPEDEAMTYGLADTIIVASVNPQTFTVSMTSVARDSYVPISCYGGNRDKINAARGTSRACLMDTVADLLDIEIDYYMEVNFLGVVQIVDALGGIDINSPVEFVGQTASGNRGEMTVWVPAGEYHADGEQALAFARERHAMPGGDFDRQKHQQEVIASIVQELLKLRDVNKALDILEAAGNNISTNLSLNQLTSVFNYIINTKNNVGAPSLFNMIDFQNMRVTGYSSWHYNYSMNLPLWIYKLYNGSIQEAKDRINDVLNNYTKRGDIDQDYFFKFFAGYPYSRGQLYSDYFDEAQEHEELPSFYPNFIGMSYEEALAWASENGVTLNVSYIQQGDSGFDESKTGLVVDQNPRQGALTTDNPIGYITVMGKETGEYTVTNCNDASSCKAFANSKGISCVELYEYFTDDSHIDGEFIKASHTNGSKIKKDEILYITIWKKKTQIVIPTVSGSASDYAKTLKDAGFVVNLVAVTEGATESNSNSIVAITDASGNPLTGGTSKLLLGETIVIKYYSYSKLPACDANATRQPDNSCKCNDGYTGDGTTCTKVEEKTPTEEQKSACAALNRTCNDDGKCGGCISGDYDDPGDGSACTLKQTDPPTTET